MRKKSKRAQQRMVKREIKARVYRQVAMNGGGAREVARRRKQMEART